MPKALNPQRRVVGDRAVVNRDWIREFTGASVGTAARWYKVRLEQPEEHRHPEKERIGGTDFYTWFQQEKASKVLKADPALHQADPEDVVSINTAAEWLGFSGASAIRKYLKDNPDYFPKPLAKPVEGPTGRMIPGFRVGDLQDFDRKRTGDKLGKAGRRPGPQPGAAVGRPSALEEALGAELSARAGGEPLTATQLAEQYAVEAIRRAATRALAAATTGAAFIDSLEAWLAPAPAIEQRRSHGRLGQHDIEDLEACARAFRTYKIGGGLRQKAVIGQLNEVAAHLDEHQATHIQQRLSRRRQALLRCSTPSSPTGSLRAYGRCSPVCGGFARYAEPGRAQTFSLNI